MPIQQRRFSIFGTAAISPPDDRDHSIRMYVSEGRMRANDLPDEIGWTNVENYPGIRDQSWEGSCFPAGTRVRLATGGSKPIEQMQVLDEVVTAEGHTGRVLRVMARKSEEMMRLRLWGHQHLRATPEHPILTERGYVPLREVQVGDWVALTRYLPRSVKEINTWDYVPAVDRLRARVNKASFKGFVTALPDFISLTPEFGRLMGLYLAEGSVTSNRVSWCFGAHEAETLVPETVGLIEHVLGAQARIEPRPNNSINVVIYGKLWRLLFSRLGGAGVYVHFVAPELEAGPEDFLAAMLDGWMAGDGHYRRKGNDGVTVARDLAVALYDIAQGLGFAPAITSRKGAKNRHAKMRKGSWSIIICDSAREGQREDFRARVTDTHAWRKVRRVEAEDFSGWVFNLSVEGDESYVAEGVAVHNCTGFSFRGTKSTVERRNRRWRSTKKRVPEFGPRGIYHLAKLLGGYLEEEGAYMRDVCKAMAEYGVTREQDWPYVAHTANDGSKQNVGKPDSDWLRNAKRWKIGAYAKVKTLDEMLVTLHRVGPLFCAMTLHDNFFETPTDTGIVPAPSGKEAGGHAMCFLAASQSRRQFYVANSWGTGFGKDGFCWIGFDHFQGADSEAWTVPDFV